VGTADRLAEFEQRLAAIEARLSALEGGSAPRVAVDDDVAPAVDDSLVTTATAHIGRVLLIFGGAYLLRAITDFGFVPTPVGILMGATYAVFWLVLAYRFGTVANRRAEAAFYGSTSTLLALPLLVEAVTHFRLLSGPQGVVALGFYILLALFVADRRALRSVAWMITGGGIVTGFAILISAHQLEAVTGLLLLLGLAVYWLVYRRGWRGMRWFAAAGANGAVMTAIALGTMEQWPLTPITAFRFAQALMLAYLLSFVIRSHLLKRPVGVFEVCQAIAVTAIALAAAAVSVRAGLTGFRGTGVVILILAVLAYVLAYSPRIRDLRAVDYYFYSTLGLVFFVAGSAMALPALGAAAAWSLAALLAAFMSGRLGWVTLSLQSTFLLLAAGMTSSLLRVGIHALTGDPASDWPAMSAAYAGIAVATVACLFIPVAQRSKRWGKAAGLPQLLVLALSVWEVGGLIVLWLATLIAGAGTIEPDLAAVAALRTAVLSAASVTLALSSRFRRWPEARWLVYPVLVIVGVKLFAEDFPHGQAASLFVALAFVGSALLLVARLLRREQAPAAH